MKTRILSACILSPLLILVWFGGKPLAVGVFVISLLGIREFFGCFEAAGHTPCRLIGYGAVLWFGALAQFRCQLPSGMEDTLLRFGLFLLVASSLLYLFSMEKHKPEDAFITVAGVLYTCFFPYHVVLIDQCPLSILVWLVFLSAFGSDTCAYFTGVAIGKHKLCPSISPKKTIEGSLGGLLGAMVLCGLFGKFFAPDQLVHCILIGLLAGAFSQLGDLSASVLKRQAGVKDFGNLIPGHGGILDRFDSVLFTAPLIYYYIALLLL